MNHIFHQFCTSHFFGLLVLWAGFTCFLVPCQVYLVFRVFCVLLNSIVLLQFFSTSCHRMCSVCDLTFDFEPSSLIMAMIACSVGVEEFVSVVGLFCLFLSAMSGTFWLQSFFVFYWIQLFCFSFSQLVPMGCVLVYLLINFKIMQFGRFIN